MIGRQLERLLVRQQVHADCYDGAHACASRALQSFFDIQNLLEVSMRVN
jgi:hypothetical protein